MKLSRQKQAYLNRMRQRPLGAKPRQISRVPSCPSKYDALYATARQAIGCPYPLTNANIRRPSIAKLLPNQSAKQPKASLSFGDGPLVTITPLSVHCGAMPKLSRQISFAMGVYHTAGGDWQVRGDAQTAAGVREAVAEVSLGRTTVVPILGRPENCV